jgi:hypothetical protein
MANTLLTIGMITREALRVLENSLTFARRVTREYESYFGIEGAKIGTSLNVRKPPKYLGRTGTALGVEDTTETFDTIVLNKQFGVDVSFTSAELALSLDDFSDRILKPAVVRVANEIDADGLALYSEVWNAVGTPGTVPSSLDTYLDAGVKLSDNAAPSDDNRSIVISPRMQAKIVDGLKSLFHQGEAIAKQYIRGKMGRAIGFDWFEDQNVATHQVGAYGGTPTVNGAGQTGSSIATSGWTANVTNLLRKGDVVTFAGVNAINPVSLQDIGVLQQFVVTANVNSNASGQATIPIAPAIVTSGNGKTVTASPANGAAVTVLGAANTVGRVGLAFHRDAITLATADLPLPRGVDMAGRAGDKQLGISIRMVRAYDVSTDKFPCRLDVLYGWKILRPEHVCRIHS